MAEAEDVITDAARHATEFARDLWRRQRPPRERAHVRVADVAPRLDILLTALFARGWTLRSAPIPPPRTLLHRLFRRSIPHRSQPVPATDGSTLWLPDALDPPDAALALRRMRVLALMQATRAARGAAHAAQHGPDPLMCALVHLLEAHAADADLVRMLPGLRGEVQAVRTQALAARPSLSAFADESRALERLVREVLALSPGGGAGGLDPAPSAAVSLQRAQELAEIMRRQHGAKAGRDGLLHDEWVGELVVPPDAVDTVQSSSEDADGHDLDAIARSARLVRTPRVRDAVNGEDDRGPGAWMVQTAQPHEHVEDPVGMQRPTDRDDSTAAEAFADSLSELPEARLVSAPGRPKEYLLSDTPHPGRRGEPQRVESADVIRYPEWDFRLQSYRSPGATVRQQPVPEGDARWVERTLEAHASTLRVIRRRFEMLRAQRTRLRRQFDGDEIDLEAWIDSHADFRAGLPRAEALYRTIRKEKRDLAVALLVDVSGSTDAWLNAQQRIIDVEREALLLVCVALQELSEPYSITSFSGEGPDGVWVRSIQGFDERYGTRTALRIAALEPERYTRSGAAIRHVTAGLMRQRARHRLLLMLSDGKPNDVDQYEGRYGVEDTRQAVMEAKLQGIFPFCLTVDRQAPSYLPQLFGASQYALLPRSERLPLVLLDWIKRLVSA